MSTLYQFSAHMPHADTGAVAAGAELFAGLGLVDVIGGQWGIVGNRLATLGSGNSVFYRVVTSVTSLASYITVDVPAGSGSTTLLKAFSILARVSAPGGSFDGYALQYDGTANWYAARLTDFGQDVFGPTIALAAPANAHKLRFVLEVTGTTTVSFRFRGYDVTGGNTLLFDQSWTDTSPTAALQGAGKAGLAYYGGNGQVFQEFQLDDAAPTDPDPGGSLVAGTIGDPESDQTTIRMTSSAESGGAGTVTRQWHRGPADTWDFTPSGSTLLSGQTTLTLTDTPPTSGLYPYALVSTDGTSTVTAVQAARLGGTPLGLLWAGCSIIAGSMTTYAIPTYFAAAAKGLIGERVIRTHNGALGGYTLQQWVDGAYDDFVAAGNALGTSVTDIFVPFESNDSAPANGPVSAGTYGTQLAALVDALRADFPDARIFVPYAPYLRLPSQGGNPISDVTTARLMLHEAYHDAIDAVVGARDNCFVLPDAWALSAQKTQSWYPGDDAIHLNEVGTFHVADNWARDWAVKAGLMASGGDGVTDQDKQDIIDGILDAPIETGVSLRAAIACIGSAAAGKSDGQGTYYAMGLSGTTTPRIEATVEDNARTAITLTPPA